MNDPITRVPSQQHDAYRQWISTISTPHSEETVIAWNLSRRLGLPPLRVIRATRGQKGQEDIQQRVDEAVRDDPSIAFHHDGRARRTLFSDAESPPPTADERHEPTPHDEALRDLEAGPFHRFAEWPITAIEKGPPGVYTVWKELDFLYVGISYRHSSDTTNPAARGLWGRLATHASGRRSGDQFNIYICDRFVVPELSDEERQALRVGARILDAQTRAFIRTHLTFRLHITATGTDARAVEHQIRTRGLPTAGLPMLNPNSTGVSIGPPFTDAD